MTKKVLIALANGFEEIEAVSIIDVLRRAGLDVVVAGVGGRQISGAHGLKVEADATVEEQEGLPDAIVLPGGMPGAENLKNSKALNDLLIKMNKDSQTIGAICAAPALVLKPAGILNGRKATCYPGFEDQFGDQVTFTQGNVVKDGHVITSRGPGSAIEFALALVENLVDSETAEDLAEKLLVK